MPSLLNEIIFPSCRITARNFNGQQKQDARSKLSSKFEPLKTLAKKEQKVLPLANLSIYNIWLALHTQLTPKLQRNLSTNPCNLSLLPLQPHPCNSHAKDYQQPGGLRAKAKRHQTTWWLTAVCQVSFDWISSSNINLKNNAQFWADIIVFVFCLLWLFLFSFNKTDSHHWQKLQWWWYS